jgi:integrase
MFSIFKANSHSHQPQRQITLNSFFDEHYFPHVTVTKRQTKHDWSVFNTHVRQQLGHYILHELTNPVLDVWVREQVIKGYQRSTINKHIHHMNRMLNLARHWGFIPMQNPTQANIKALILGDYRQRFLSKEEISTLLKHSKASRHPFIYYIISLLLNTGARIGEVRTIKWCDIDMPKRIWTVPRSKNGRSRRIVLNSSAIKTLELARSRGSELFIPQSAHDYVFINPTTDTAYQSFDAAWYKVRAAANLYDVRLHDLRHTFASLLVNQGVSLYEVQKLLGHSSIQMTQRYAHLEPDRLHRRAELLSSIISEKVAQLQHSSAED